MVQIICLANSYRESKRCVAGIEPTSGKWLRPIPPDGGGLTTEQTSIAGRPADLLDVLEIELDVTRQITEYQIENRVIRDQAWRRVEHLTPTQIIKYVDNSSPVLHSTSDRVPVSMMQQLPQCKWTSLQLVHCQQTSFTVDNRGRWRVRFNDEAGAYYSLNLTDPVALDRLNHMYELGSDCLLTVSMTVPWQSDADREAYCYKVVAAVIELQR